MTTTHAINKIKRMLTGLVAIIILGGFLAPAIASAHDAYNLSITLNPDQYQFVGTVTSEKNNIQFNNHVEKKNAAYLLDLTLPFKTNGSDSVERFDIPNYLSGFEGLEGKSPVKGDVLPFTFPGVHHNQPRQVVKGWFGVESSSRNADQNDRQQAQWVNNNLIGSLNKGINFVRTIAVSRDNGEKRLTTIFIASSIANAGSEVSIRNGASAGSSKEVKIFDETFVFSDASNDKNATQSDGIEKIDYIKILHKGSQESIVLPWSVEKGYGEGQRMWDFIEGTKYAEESQKDLEFLSWQHVVLQGMGNSIMGIEFGNAEAVNPPNIIESTIAETITSMQLSIESLLGLHTVPEMMLNRGSYKMTNWEGIMPKSLADVADYVHVFVQLIAWLILGGGLVKLLTMRNLSALNPKMRVDLKDGIMDLIIAGFALLMFIPVFKSIVVLNSGLVQFFGGISDQADLFGLATMTQGGYLGPVIIGLVFLLLSVYLNIVYILRGITIAALYIFAPLFIASIAYGGKFKQLFSTFAKELIGMIFMQSIHALLLSMYSLAFYNGAASSLLYTIILTASFIPITNFIRKDLLGISGGIGSAIAGGAVSAGAGFAIASMGAARANAKSSGSSGGASQGGNTFKTKTTTGGGGGGGGGGNQTFNSLLDNDKAAGGSTPSHYAGENPGFKSKVKDGSQSITGSMKRKASDMARSTGQKLEASATNAVKNAPRTALNAAKLGTKATLFAAAATAELGTESKGISSTAMHAMIHSKGGSGGSSGGGYNNGSHSSVEMPTVGYLDQYEMQPNQSGFLVSAGKDNGDIVNIHDNDGLKQDTGANQFIDNGDHLMVKYNNAGTNPEDQDIKNRMFDDMNSNDPERKAHWQNIGIDYANKNDQGELIVGFNKKRIGLNEFEQNKTHSKFDMKPYADNEFFKAKHWPIDANQGSNNQAAQG